MSKKVLLNLDNILAYSNPEVLSRYRYDYPNNTLTAEIAFRELMKFLWLSEKLRLELEDKKETDQFSSVILNSMKEVDDMWHTFIIHTNDYTEFSHRYFGRYLHHQPASIAELDALRNDRLHTIKRIRKWVEYVYDNLGEETVEIWFKSYLVSDQK
ncbi:MAG: hypothetical protein AAGA27_03275 [Pseudomonadota bacterium]